MRRGDVEKRLRRLENELAEAKEHLDGLVGAHRLLQHEWEETHRKLIKQLQSINRAGGKKLPADDEILQPAGVPSGPDEISAAIHARRNRGLPNPQSEAGG